MLFYPQGVSYDHIELHFFINGKAVEVSISGIKGTTFPVLYGNAFDFKLLSEYN